MSIQTVSDGIKLKNHMDFNNRFLRDLLDWTVENIFQKIWLDDDWHRCAKGGDQNEKFSQYRDMDYLAHIFSGASMALKVIDYKYTKSPINEEKLQQEIILLKRSIFGYLFHDYNKLTGADYKMRDKDSLFKLVNKHFARLRDDLGLTNDEIYQIAFSTEDGTEYNILRNSNIRSNVARESDFSKLADVLSSKFNKDSIEGSDYYGDIHLGPEPIIPGKYLRKIDYGITPLFASADVLRKACRVAIEESNGFYLWSTNKAIYYVNADTDDIIHDKIEPKFKELISKIMRPENTLSFNDRRVNNSVSGIAKHTAESLKRFARNDSKIRQCLWLEDIKIDERNRDSAERYSDEVTHLTHFYSINFRALKDKPDVSIRDGLSINSDYSDEQDSDVQDNERLKVLMTRYVQLKSGIESTNAERLRSVLHLELEKNKDGILRGLLGKIPRNSALLIPLVVQSEKIDWDQLLTEILADLNSAGGNVDYRELISRIIFNESVLEELPEVPDKFHISMINAYPANDKALGENLYGINTNTFNNRLPTSGISNGKIDEISKFEFALRKNIVPRSRNGGEGLMFLYFPGAVPFLDMSEFMSNLSFSTNTEGGGMNELNLAVGEIKENLDQDLRLDTSFFYSIGQINADKDVLKYVYQALEIYRRTKMLVRLSFSNAPFFEDQYEAVRIEVGNSFCSPLGWEKIRCNKTEKVRNQIITFNVIANGSLTKINFDKSSNIIMDYIRNPMSLFYHVHKLVFNKEGGNLKAGFGKQFSQKIEEIRELAYETDKDGGRKMKNISDLAKSAATLVRPSWKMSNNDRTWMLRDSIEAIEKAMVSITSGDNRDLDEYKEFIEGIIFKTLQRDREKNQWMPKETDIIDFADRLIKLLKEDFDGKIPSSSMKSYLLNAFEFEYMLTGTRR